MKRSILPIALLCGHAAAQTVVWLPEGFIASDISADGSVLAGNCVGDGSYETFRWTEQTGVQRLGRATVPVLGVGAGSPDISYDGLSISATILSSDSRQTQGIWNGGSWIETMPPLPPGGIILDQAYGSAWGLSGDGLTLTGFFWVTGGDAQGSKWSKASGMVALPQTPGRSARINAANYDGSVVAGWEERPDGAWEPRAWRGLTKYTLGESPASSMVNSVNAGGDILVGKHTDLQLLTRVAAIWRWDGAQYTPQLCGYLPGTVLQSGSAQFNGVSDDGAMAVGDNLYNFSPGGPRDGIVWTAAGGLVSDVAYLASLNVTMPANVDIRAFDAISADGRAIVGSVVRLDTFKTQTFLLHLPAACYPDCNSDGALNLSDFGCFQTKFALGEAYADCNGDGVRNLSDFGCFQTKFALGCP